MINSHAIYIDKLNPAYQSVFRQISDYVMSANMDEIRNEEILSEVLDTFLSAQNEGKAVEQIIGNDLKAFCEQLCSEKSIKSRVINFFELLHPVFLMYFFICIFDLIDMLLNAAGEEGFRFLTYRSHESLGAYILGGLIWIAACYISKFYLNHNMFRYPQTYKLRSGIIKAAVIAVQLAVLLFLFHDTEAEGTYLWLSFACCAGFLLVYRIMTRESRRYRKENRISWAELAGGSASLTADIEQTEMKRFEKLNLRRKKKNQAALSFEAFLDREEQNCNQWDKKPAFYIGLMAGSAILGAIFTYFMSGFAQFYDGFIFVAAVLAIEALPMFGLYKAADAGTKARIRWIESKRKRDDENMIPL